MSDSKPTGSSGSALGATTPKAGSGAADPKTVPPTPGATASAPTGGSSGSMPVAPAPGSSTSAPPLGGSSGPKPVPPAPGTSASAPPGGSSAPKPVAPAPVSTASAPPATGSSGPKPVPSTAGTTTSAPPLGGTPKPAEPTPSSSSSAPPAGSSDPKPVPSAPGSTASASPGGSSAGSSGPKPVAPTPGSSSPSPTDSPLDTGSSIFAPPGVRPPWFYPQQLTPPSTPSMTGSASGRRSRGPYGEIPMTFPPSPNEDPFGPPGGGFSYGKTCGPSGKVPPCFQGKIGPGYGSMFSGKSGGGPRQVQAGPPGFQGSGSYSRGSQTLSSAFGSSYGPPGIPQSSYRPASGSSASLSSGPRQIQDSQIGGYEDSRGMPPSMYGPSGGWIVMALMLLALLPSTTGEPTNQTSIVSSTEAPHTNWPMYLAVSMGIIMGIGILLALVYFCLKRKVVPSPQAISPSATAGDLEGSDSDGGQRLESSTLVSEVDPVRDELIEVVREAHDYEQANFDQRKVRHIRKKKTLSYEEQNYLDRADQADHALLMAQSNLNAYDHKMELKEKGIQVRTRSSWPAQLSTSTRRTASTTGTTPSSRGSSSPMSMASAQCPSISPPPVGGSFGLKPATPTSGTSTSAPPLGGTPKPAEATPSGSPTAAASEPKTVPSTPGSSAQSASPRAKAPRDQHSGQ